MDYTGLAQQISAVHTFPGRYTIKLIGASHQLGEPLIRDAVFAVLPDADFSLSCKASSADRFFAWTLDVQVADVETVIRLYTSLESLPGLKALL